MNDQENNDPVWKLIGKSRKLKASPFFARNVVRQIRMEGGARTSKGWAAFIVAWFRKPAFAVPALAVIALVAVILILPDRTGLNTVATPSDPAGPEAVQSVESFDPAEEIESIDYLGQLMVVTDPADLGDSALADLLF